MNVQRASVMTIPHELIARLMRSMRLLFPDSPGDMTCSLSSDMNLGMLMRTDVRPNQGGSVAARAALCSSASKMAQLHTCVACVVERVGPELVWYTTGIPVIYQSRVTPLNTPKTLRRFGFTYNVLRNTH